MLSAPGGIGSGVQIWDPPGLGQKQGASPSRPQVSHISMLPSRQATAGPTVLGWQSFLFVIIKTRCDKEKARCTEQTHLGVLRQQSRAADTQAGPRDTSLGWESPMPVRVQDTHLEGPRPSETHRAPSSTRRGSGPVLGMRPTELDTCGRATEPPGEGTAVAALTDVETDATASLWPQPVEASSGLPASPEPGPRRDHQVLWGPGAPSCALLGQNR